MSYLGVSDVDVGIDYIHKFTKEKTYTVAGSYFGRLEVHVLICVRYIYDLKTSM